MKKLWLDTETTGLSPIINDVAQVAGIIEINRQTVETFCIFSRPEDFINIDPKALAVNGLTIEQLQSFAPAELAYNQFNKILSKYVDINNQYDRLIPCGHCVNFDVDFVSAWSTKAKNDNFYLHHNRLDLMSLVLVCKDLGIYSGHTTLTAIANG
jgi:DNA polymerase III alpha subunit (gram-positive type)